MVLAISVSYSWGQSDEEYTKSLKTMFELAGTEETYKVAIEQMMDIFRQQYASLDAEIWDEMEDEFMKTSMSDLVVMLTPVYKKYLTQTDLDDINAFYRSPVGQKLGKNTALITQESMIIGQEWGRQIGEKLMKKIEERN